MNRRLVLAASLLLTLSAVFLQAVALPGRMFACSCIAPPPTLAEIATTTDAAIVAGTVGRALPDRTPIAVNTWFHGANATEVVWLNVGSQAMTSCDIFMSAGEQRLLVLFPAENGMYSANSCSPGALLGEPGGDEMLAQAVEAFGGGPPPTAEPEPVAPIPPAEPQSGPGAGLIWVAVAVTAAVVLFGAVALLALRRRPS